MVAAPSRQDRTSFGGFREEVGKGGGGVGVAARRSKAWVAALRALVRPSRTCPVPKTPRAPPTHPQTNPTPCPRQPTKNPHPPHHDYV